MGGRATWRGRLAFGCLWLLIGLLAGFAWLTNNPDTPWLDRAVGWPAPAGPVAELLRDWLRPPPPLPPPIQPAEPEPEPGAPPTESAAWHNLEPVDSVTLLAASETVWLEAGASLRRRPDVAAPVAVELPVTTNGKLLDRRGGWTEVGLKGRRGWTRDLAPARAATPPLGSAPTPTGPASGLAPAEDRLALARRLLGDGGGGGPRDRLGPYPLYSDVADRELLAFLDRVAAATEDAYRRRYGLAPVGEPAAGIVLFAEEAGYRRFQDADAAIAGLAAAGHAGSGLAAFYAERPHPELARTLVHELVHLLNRRALGPALPPWIEEGMAGDLATATIGPDGAIDPERLGGEVERSAPRIDLAGPYADLTRLADALENGILRPTSELVTLDRATMQRMIHSDLHQIQAAFFIRYLLTAEQGRLAAPFKSFLESVRDGGPATGDALLEQLGRDWPRVELGFKVWVLAEKIELEQRLAVGQPEFVLER